MNLPLFPHSSLCRLAVVIAILLSSNAPNAAAQEPLFNGKDLTGWKSNSPLWRVEDGVLIARLDDKAAAKSHTLRSERSFGNLYISCEAMLPKGARDCGLCFRVGDDGAGGYQVGLGEVAWGQLVGDFPRGGLLASSSAGDSDGGAGRWHRIEALAIGSQIWTAVDGKLVAAVDVPRGPAKGRVGFRIGGEAPLEARFREIRIQADPPMRLAGLTEAPLQEAIASRDPLLAVPSLQSGVAPEWIWADAPAGADQKTYFRRIVHLERPVTAAVLRIAADKEMTVFIDGKEIADAVNYKTLVVEDVTRWLSVGDNILAVEARNHTRPVAILLALDLRDESGVWRRIISDHEWLATDKRQRQWQTDRVDRSNWKGAVSLGKLGAAPWGTPTEPTRPSADETTGRAAALADKNYDQWKEASFATEATPASKIKTLPGFEVARLRSAAPNESSWISLAFDSRGRILIGKEGRDGNPGILRATLPKSESEQLHVEHIDETLTECRGLLWAYDSLYAQCNVATPQRPTGLYRLRDTDGDDRFEDVKLLRTYRGGGHGNNDLALGPDGHLYLIQGDASGLPADWDRKGSPVGHNAKDVPAPGYVIRTDREGKLWQVIACGLRNPYGVDFNPDGELFTYDADMELHVGLPWYRPTHLVHLVSGTDYGWRLGDRPWPLYYPERPPVTLQVGLGSPTSVKFGTRSNFPPKYRQSLFILEWSYGRILAAPLTPKGASYTCELEPFLDGRPLNVTDLDFGPDGAMYFITGGRGTLSGLYRVRYVGGDAAGSIANVLDSDTPAAAARTLRHRLESFHGHANAKAIDFAWPHLASSDPWSRHAARVAIEAQPVAQWSERAFAEQEPTAALTAMLALARTADASHKPQLLDRLNATSWERLNFEQRLMLLRAYELVIERLSPPEKSPRTVMLDKLDAAYPAGTVELDRELSFLLKTLGAPSLVAKTLTVAKRTDAQGDRLYFLRLLEDVKEGWTRERTLEYFQMLAEMKRLRGGREYIQYVRQCMNTAMARLSAGERGVVARLVASLDAAAVVPETSMPPRSFVRSWKLDELLGDLGKVDRDRDFERGRTMFAVACAKCHQVAQTGGLTGPDLSTVSRRFSRRDILRSILEPSAVIDEKYAVTTIVTDDGATATGALLDENDKSVTLSPDPLVPKTVVVEKSRIEERRLSPISLMPDKLLDTLSRDEILDLLAYIEADGNERAPLFRQK